MPDSLGITSTKRLIFSTNLASLLSNIKFTKSLLSRSCNALALVNGTISLKFPLLLIHKLCGTALLDLSLVVKGFSAFFVLDLSLLVLE